MKKLFVLLSAMLLSAAVMWGQDKLALVIFPSNSGNFIIWYSTYKAPPTRAVVVDWGDGNKIVYNNAYPDGAIPQGEINGTVTKGKPIKLYSTCLDAIYIATKMDWIDVDSPENVNNMEFFYYWHQNLSRFALENLYRGLNNRSGKEAGELHLINNQATYNNVGTYNEIRHANGFSALEKKWYITSSKPIFHTKWSNRAHWDINTREKMQEFLTPAITMSPDAGQTLKLGSMDINRGYIGYSSSPISIVNKNNSFTHSPATQRQESETSFSSTAMVSAIVAAGSNPIKIYGARVTHLDCEKAHITQIVTNEMRYIRLGNSKATVTPAHVSNQTNLKMLNMYNSGNLTSLDLSKNTALEILNVGGCNKMTSLKIGSTKLKTIDLSYAYALASYPDFSKLTALTNLEIDNCKLTACQLDDIYKNLPSSTANKNIKVSNLQTGGNANDYKGANHTLATAKRWYPYGADEGGNSETYTNNGGGCVIDYYLSVAGFKVTSANASKITGNGISGTVSYNNSTKTLTLNNAKITGSHISGGGNYIEFYGIESYDDLKVNLIGNNVMDIYNGTPGQQDEGFGWGINCSKKLTLSGTGKLHIERVTSDAELQSYYCGIRGTGVVIDNATVTTGTKMDVGISCNNSTLSVINGATLECKKKITDLSAHPTSFSGAVLLEGDNSSSMKKVSKFTLTSSSSGGKTYYSTKSFVTIRPAGTGLESLSSQGIRVAGGKGEIRITTPAELVEANIARVYNLSGSLVRTVDIKGGDILIPNISEGIYIVRIGDGAEKVIVR